MTTEKKDEPQTAPKSSKSQKSKPQGNVCPDCQQLPESSGLAGDGVSTVYTCGAGHQWLVEE